jgi:putative tricarboxylic transport membrane protein
MKSAMYMYRDHVMAIIWILLGFVLSFWSATFPFNSASNPGPAVLPFACGLLFVALGIILLLQTRAAKGNSTLMSAARLLHKGEPLKRVGLTSAGMILAVVLLDHLGYVATVFLLLLFLLKAIESKGWKVAIFYALSCSVGSYILFKVILKTALPAGILGF